MNILILSPGQREYELRLAKQFIGFHRSTLPLLAALIPVQHNITILDESIDGKIDPLQLSYDLVCISTMTAFAPRAYELSQSFRRQGATVLVGGIHASALPYEALQYCDAVCIGEGETVLPEMIRQVERGGLEKRIYTAAYPPNIELDYPEPRWDLASKSVINVIKTIDISRGCPHRCSFCSVSSFQGSRFRFRSVDSIMREVKASKGKYFYFNSDNIVGNKSFAKQLFARLGESDIKWVSQSSISIADNNEVLDLARKSGCYGLCIGFESITQNALDSSNKRMNRVEEYRDAVKRIHDHGICIQGSFIFGFDEDGKGIAEETLEFVTRAKLDLAFPHVLTPYPGTLLYNQFKKENRLIATIYPTDWKSYDTSHVVFRPKRMKECELQDEYNFFLKESYSLHSICKRSRPTERSVSSLAQYVIANIFHGYKNRKIIGTP